jgi:hypothetical protein
MSPSIVRAWLDRHRAARLLREARRGVSEVCTIVAIDELPDTTTTVRVTDRRDGDPVVRARILSYLTARRQYANACEAWATVGEG